MSTTNCPNCGSAITCGCQRRTASNGTQVCGSCVTQYEQQLLLQIQNNTQENR